MTSGVTPGQRQLARWLLEQELAGYSAGSAAAAAGVGKKLTGQLARIFSELGSEALLKRALHLALQDSGWPTEMNSADGTDLLSNALGCVPEADVLPFAEAVLSNIIALLASFIGEDVTLRALREVWPTASLAQTEPAGQKDVT